MQYIVVRGEDKWMENALGELETKVEKLCQAGWKPQGGISIAIKDDYEWCHVCQAMVK